MPSVITGLRGRLLLYQVVALVVLLSAFGLYSIQIASRAQSQAFAQEIQLANAVARGLDGEFHHVAADARSYLSSASFSGAVGTLAPLYEHLASQEGVRFLQVKSVRLVGAGGDVLAAAPPGTTTLPETMPPGEAVLRAKAEGVPVVVASRLSSEGQSPFAAVIVPLPTAVLPGGGAVVIDTAGLATIDLFAFTQEEDGGQASQPAGSRGPYAVEVFGPDGVVLTTSLGAKALGVTSRHYAVMKEFMGSGEARAIVHRPKGRPGHIIAGIPLGSTPFFLVAEEPQGLLLDWPRQLREQAILLGGIAAFLILLLGWMLGRQIVLPLGNLRRATARIKGGDLDSPVRVKAHGEIAQLAAEVDAMRARLKETVSQQEHLTKSLMDQVAERTDRLHTVLQRLMVAQEEERRRVARDLHDETAQGLSALGLLLDEAAINAAGDQRQALESIRNARKQVNRLVEETRRLVYALRPSVLDDAGLAPALRWCAEAYLESKGVQVTFQVSRPEVRFPESVEVALFRVGQEAMSNIARHAQASHAWVTLERGGEGATLTVRDDGVGFNQEAAMAHRDPASGRGLGLAGMQERAGLLGGRLDISSAPGAGTTVTAYVPRGPVE
ncbi:MAG: HAMP domain-containing protein [Chloroflexi bacterium]|nr:HAMP domain-containing protein [Chloroflexota bacterium]